MRRQLLVILLLTAACATNDDFNGPRREPGRRQGSRMGAGTDLLPPSQWWRSPYIADAVKLEPDQIDRLDRLQKEKGEDLDKLQEDLRGVTGDLRSKVEQRNPTVDEILAAGNRLADLRDQIFRRQIAMLAEERAILSDKQWAALQDQLEEGLRPRMDDRRRGGYGGPRRGPRPGGRGWPGGAFSK